MRVSQAVLLKAEGAKSYKVGDKATLPMWGAVEVTEVATDAVTGKVTGPKATGFPCRSAKKT